MKTSHPCFRYPTTNGDVLDINLTSTFSLNNFFHSQNTMENSKIKPKDTVSSNLFSETRVHDNNPALSTVLESKQ